LHKNITLCEGKALLICLYTLVNVQGGYSQE